MIIFALCHGSLLLGLLLLLIRDGRKRRRWLVAGIAAQVLASLAIFWWMNRLIAARHPDALHAYFLNAPVNLLAFAYYWGVALIGRSREDTSTG